MIKQEKALIISGSTQGLDQVISFLKSCGCSDVSTLQSASEARRCTQQENFSIILINSPLKDELGHQLAQQLSESTSAGIILLCRADQQDGLFQQAIGYGIGIVSKPINRVLFQQAIYSALAIHNRLNSIWKENEKLHQKLEESRYIFRAKLYLVLNRSMTEEEAHHYIEKRAMDTRRPKKEIALELINLYSD